MCPDWLWSSCLSLPLSIPLSNILRLRWITFLRDRYRYLPDGIRLSWVSEVERHHHLWSIEYVCVLFVYCLLFTVHCMFTVHCLLRMLGATSMCQNSLMLFGCGMGACCLVIMVRITEAVLHHASSHCMFILTTINTTFHFFVSAGMSIFGHF